MSHRAPPPRRPPITPPAGSKSRAEARSAPPRTRSALGGPTPRSRGQRGSENVSLDDAAPPSGKQGVSDTRRSAEDEYFDATDPAEARRAQARDSARATPQGRGNEGVRSDDLNSRAHQATKGQWDRVEQSIEYLRSYVEHLEAQARNKDHLTPVEAIRLQNRVHLFRERIGDMIKSPAEKIFDILRFTVIPELMQDAGVTSLTVEGIGRCNIIDDITVSVPAEHKAAFNEWLIEMGFEDLITQTVNAQTLAKFVREQLKKRDGVKLPTELIKINPVTRAQITRV